MKRVFMILIVFVASIILSNRAIADDAADVKAAWLKSNAALNSGNADAASQSLHPEATLFNYGGRTLNDRWFNPEGLKAAFEAGLKCDWNANHLNVKVYGNAAVVTGYHVGTITPPNGNVSQGTRRFSEFWIKQDGKWTCVHRHASQLEPVPRETLSPPEATNGQ